jgi:hypothetical protein
VYVVAGGASAAEIGAIDAGRPGAGLRARFVPLFAWQDDAHVYVQPSTALSPGAATLVFLVDRRAPVTFDFVVADGDAPIVRAWPVADARAAPDAPITYCATSIPTALPATITIDPGGAITDVVRRADSPCVDLVPRDALSAGTHVMPPAIGDGDHAMLLDPSPIVVAPGAEPHVEDARCEGSIALGPVCLRVDDDRATLLGADLASALVLGGFDDRPVIAPLVPGGRAVIDGLVPASAIPISLVVRTDREARFVGTIHTAPAHPHLVVNEVLAHPPSNAAAQRFVELVADGASPVSTAGMVLLDGDARVPLPTMTLDPGEIVLVVDAAFVDGFGGDVAPASHVRRLLIGSTTLRLTGPLSLVDADGRTLSRFPGSTSTRTASRGRRSPETPDDAPAGFGFDAHGRATPGRTNEIE